MSFIRIISSNLYLSELNGKFRNKFFLPINIMILDCKSISNNYSILLHTNLILTNKANFK
jgi:hypothetical protein